MVFSCRNSTTLERDSQVDVVAGGVVVVITIHSGRGGRQKNLAWRAVFRGRELLRLFRTLDLDLPNQKVFSRNVVRGEVGTQGGFEAGPECGAADSQVVEGAQIYRVGRRRRGRDGIGKGLCSRRVRREQSLVQIFQIQQGNLVGLVIRVGGHGSTPDVSLEVDLEGAERDDRRGRGADDGRGVGIVEVRFHPEDERKGGRVGGLDRGRGSDAQAERKPGDRVPLEQGARAVPEAEVGPGVLGEQFEGRDGDEARWSVGGQVEASDGFRAG